jgi:hypothetical protein
VIDSSAGLQPRLLDDLPAWGQADLPEPKPFTVGNVFRTIGPGAILLAASIGGGEWLVGPAATVAHGTGILWIATAAILLQLLFNLEAIRYTLYTGEPILTGIMRLRPGSRFWGTAYSLIAIVQLGVPALAVGCAPVIMSIYLGEVPKSVDNQTRLLIVYGVVALGVILLCSGKKIERTLELVSWGMIVYIFSFLLYVNAVFVPLEHSLNTLLGFVNFGTAPRQSKGGIDVLLLATLAATAGSGGLGNLTISNWARDKGFGMGGTVGAIASAFATGEPALAHSGKVFPLSTENLNRWRLWWKYVHADQVFLWGLGCFVGMYLNVNLATAIIPHGTDLQDLGAGAYQAQYMARELWSGLWYLGLLNGIWILFSTHLGNTDAMVRTITDITWTASTRARAWRGGSVTAVYYVTLALTTAFGLVALHFGGAMDLFKFLGFVANIVLAMGAVQILCVNYKLLPPALRAPLWRQILLGTCCIFYATITAFVLYDQIPKVPNLINQMIGR